MTMHHHLDGSTLLSLGAGSIDESLAIVAASHVARCPACADALAEAEAIGGVLLSEIEPTPISPGAGATLLARLHDEDSRIAGQPDRKPRARDLGLPPALCQALGKPIDALKWRKVAPGIALHEVELSPGASGRLRVWRLAPGKATPAHGHGGSEITLVLKGSLVDVLGHYTRGDVADLGDDVEHAPVAGGDDECICVIASETRTRFKTLLARLLQPILGT